MTNEQIAYKQGFKEHKRLTELQKRWDEKTFDLSWEEVSEMVRIKQKIRWINTESDFWHNDKEDNN